MTTTTFYERRKEGRAIDFGDRRAMDRRTQRASFSPERRRLASQIRRHEREAFKIPVQLKLQDQEISGYTHDISPEGLLVFAKSELQTGTPLTLKFSFGENVCYLNVSGQVVFCIPSENGGSPTQAVGIKFAAIREFEQKILTFTVQEFKQISHHQGKSLLEIHAGPDLHALQAADFSNNGRPHILLKDTSGMQILFRSISLERWRELICGTLLYRRLSERRAEKRQENYIQERRCRNRRASTPYYHLRYPWRNRLPWVALLAFRDFLILNLPVWITRIFTPKVEFVFMAHFRGVEDIPHKFEFAQHLPQSWVTRWLRFQWPIIGSYITGFKLKNGIEAKGAFVLVPLTGKQMMRDLDLAKDKVVQGVKLSERIGAKIIGLGGFTSIVTDNGRSLEQCTKASLTTGTALSAAIAIENVIGATELLGFPLMDASVAIVGAAGAVGSACARVLSEHVKQLILIDINGGALSKVCNELPCKNIVQGSSMELLKKADIAVAVTNAPRAIIKPEHLKPGAIIIDCAQPKNVSKNVALQRPDVLVIESAVLKTPGIEININMGISNMEAYGCLAETMVLTWLGWKGHFGLGPVSASDVSALAFFAKQAGLSLAYLRNSTEYISEHALRSCYEAAHSEPEKGKANLQLL